MTTDRLIAPRLLSLVLARLVTSSHARRHRRAGADEHAATA